MNSQRHCMNWLRRIVAILLIALMLAGSFPGTVPQAYAAQSGMVRVKLTRLGSRSTLEFAPTCAYKAGSVSIPSGTKVKVTAANGALTMNVGGNSYSMGEKMSLAKQGSGMTGIKFSSPSMSNIFCGDLVLYASGNTITPVLHMYIEDYLYGVVAYEMSNSYPVEALKAQAVAARNYAMMMAASRRNYTYDVTDNTNSQVYKGYNSSYQRVIQAVDETAGCMLYSGSSLAKCYYAASNGGQTDSTKNVWGGNLSYSVVKDDPYDLEATSARKKSTTIPRFPTASNPLDSTLRSWLIEGIAADIEKAGVTADSVSIEEITAVEPHSPKYAAPSILYKQLKFTMDCTGRNAAGEKVAFTASCDIATYGKLETQFNLSINSGSNETVMVTSDEDSYTVTFRRYGHGIGMSQHGARIMALNYGKTFDEILEFYYPGTTLKKVSLSNTVGSTNVNGSIAPDGSDFKAGDKVVVSLADAEGTLNLREKADASSALLAKLPNKTELTLLAVSGGWGKVEYDGKTGYILLGYVIRSEAESAPTTSPAPEGTTATVQLSSESSSLNVREKADTGSAIVTKVSHGATVSVLEIGNEWSKISVNGAQGYVLSKYLVIVEAEITPEPTPDATQEPAGEPVQKATVKLSDSGSKLNVRKKASTTSSIVTKVKHGAEVEVIAIDGKWANISVDGKVGYVMVKYLVLQEVEATPAPTATPEPTTTPEVTPEPTPEATEEPAVQTAKVKLSSSSSKLNVRKTASTSASIVTKVKHGAIVEVVEIDGKWAKISANGKTGYVLKKYLVLQEAAATPVPTVTPEPTPEATQEPTEAPAQTAKVKLSSSSSKLNVRKTASTSAGIVTQVKHGAIVEVVETSGKWAKITANGKTGYVLAKYLVMTEVAATPEPTVTPEPTPTVTPEPENEQATIRLSSSSSYLNLRKSKSTSSASLAKMRHGAVVEVLEKDGKWAKISYGGKTGYVLEKYLGAAPEPTATPEPTAAPTPAPTATPEPDPVTIQLSSSSSYLNLRKSKSTSSASLAKLKHGTAVEVVEIDGSWAKITAGGKTGYVQTKYLKNLPEDLPQATPTVAPTATPDPDAPDGDEFTIALSGDATFLNIRKNMDTGAESLGKLYNGDKVLVIIIEGDWAQIYADGVTGYIPVKYLADEPFVTPEPTAVPEDDDSLGSYDVLYTAVATKDLTLLADADENSAAVADISEGDEVKVVDANDEWCYVLYDSFEGFIATENLKKN